MSARVLISVLTVPVLLAMVGPAHARPVQIDMTDAFNEDVIVNGTTLGNLDETQATVDVAETSLITKGAAQVLPNCVEDPDGLPNTGRVAANQDHPLVNLAYDNRKDGKNARRTPEPDSYRVSVPHRRYRAIHVFATSGNGTSVMKVKLLYGANSSPAELFLVQDWFAEPAFGYPLIDGRDRVEPDASTCHDDDTTAIWGFKVKAKARRTLKAVKITRPESDDDQSVLNVFGMTGTTARRR